MQWRASHTRVLVGVSGCALLVKRGDMQHPLAATTPLQRHHSDINNTQKGIARISRACTHRIATLSSLASMVPEPSVSKRSNASLISCFCSSVRPASWRKLAERKGDRWPAGVYARLQQAVCVEHRRTSRAAGLLVAARCHDALAVTHGAETFSSAGCTGRR